MGLSQGPYDQLPLLFSPYPSVQLDLGLKEWEFSLLGIPRRS